ncbi:MAG: hypothetical protein WC414_04160 [Patescibacteria group bacterium]
MKKILSILALILLLLPVKSKSAEFDPNFIISDDELQNSESMNLTDIQTFLEVKNSYLTNYKTENWEGITKKASSIIYEAAKENEINPKYLLVKLQKEQSLVLNEEPSQKQLDWATGYGISDDNTTTDDEVQKYKGFGVQVDRAAGIMRWYYDNYKKISWIKREGQIYIIDGEVVIPRSNATGFLYTYTPHIHGNKNFWIIWNDWFKQIYPDGSLLKSIDSADVYLIQNGEKRKFKNMISLVSRYDPKMIIEVSPEKLNQYTESAEISLPNYSIVKQGTKYYLLDYDYKREFLNYEVVKNLGYNPDEIIEVDSEDLEDYLDGTIITLENKAPFGELVRIKETKSLYYLDENTYYPIYDEQIAKINFPHLQIHEVNINRLYNLNEGDGIRLKNGTIFGIVESNKIYVVENGKKRHIANEDVFNTMNYNWNNIVWINKTAGMLYEDGEAIYI